MRPLRTLLFALVLIAASCSSSPVPESLASADEDPVSATTSLATPGTAVEQTSSQIDDQEIYEAVEQQLLEMENRDEYLAQLEEGLVTDEAAPQRVLVVVGDIQSGESLSEALSTQRIEVREISPDFVPEGAVLDLSQIEGSWAAGDLVANQILTEGMFVGPDLVSR